MTRVVTRFAPSPTGYLHIGGARTALFNWLFARGAAGGNDGQFLLRIEDTDRARHNAAAVDAILDGLTWLGLDWDGEPVSQFSRAARHAEVAHQLLESGRAYRCWLAGDELNAARSKAREANVRFESPWRDHSGTTPDDPFAIRLKAPQDGEVIVRDMVQGDVRFSTAALDDMVLLRSDGTPTYMLAVVVDDHDMAISHVIRGDDHLINGARQQQLFDALDWAVPIFAHVPLIHGQDGAKLSKRHGALGVEAYRDDGFLSEGLANYLLKLGWSHGDDEIISMSDAKSWFDIGGIKKAPARLDLDKLNHVNAHYMKKLDPKSFVTLATPFIQRDYSSLSPAQSDRLERAVPFLKERAKNMSEVPAAAAFVLVERPLKISGKTAKPLKRDGVGEILAGMIDRLEAIDDWQEQALDNLLSNYAGELGVGFGQIGPPARAALTAGEPSPSLGQVLFALGRDESLSRLRDQLV